MRSSDMIESSYLNVNREDEGKIELFVTDQHEREKTSKPTCATVLAEKPNRVENSTPAQEVVVVLPSDSTKQQQLVASVDHQKK